ncbi:MAG: protein translocase subunit SecF [Ruminobacter sp.]|nr:protein translocase subunit SecF [Ruminobacter sp.]
MFQIIKPGTVIPFMKIAKLVEAIFLTAVLIFAFMLGFKGLNWGLDFTGGVVIEVQYPKEVSLDTVRKELADGGISNAVVQNFGTTRDISIRIQPKGDENQKDITEKVKTIVAKNDPGVAIARSEYVGPAVGQELVVSGVISVVLSLVILLIYIAMRFEWRMATGAIISLVYDVIVVLGVFSVCEIEYDLTVLASVLTVIGYSLNDKIVVFDRIRENARKLHKMQMVDLFNLSLTETFSRTIITSLTTLITVVALLLFGGEMIYGFSLALFIGIVFGTMSSIYVASTWPLFLGITRENLLVAEVKKDQEEISEADY